MAKSHRKTIHLEQAEVLSHDAFDAKQFVLRVKAPQLAAKAKPGQFAHIQCGPELPMRRPISIMLTDPNNGSVDFLYKVFGRGTHILSQRKVGEKISILGPIGNCFQSQMDKPRALLIGGGVGIPPMVFLARSLLAVKGAYDPFVIMGSEVPFPFKAQPSRYVVPGMAAGVTAAMPLMEDWEIPSRLASLQGYPGCHEGYVTDVARQWLDALSDSQRQEVAVFACGPHPMLEAVAKMAQEYHLPCQTSLEEFMACAVGGCAGCVVEIQTPQGSAMKRVCVDGPVFDARSVAAFL
ncbi:MAG: dihydroorotate dehydrogenase electron transfer subunit [Gammaproteobacteria bacterium]|nr:dihydroorotate dehydrogenase electron transfer subunit [Gammaproteobacteria bacterium]MDH5802114.1 dihydroorotate dehydrogenase electron transfer subunit [Gammaproteobacteria bacterium]